jgi:Sulfatase
VVSFKYICAGFLSLLKKLKPTLAFILSVCFLDGLLNIRYPASDLPLWALLKLSPEALGIILIIWLATVLKIRFQAAVYIPLIAWVIFLRLFRIGDVLVPMYFFRPFNLYLDSRFLPDLIHLLYTTFPRRTFTFGALAAVGLLIGITWLAKLSFKAIHSYLLSSRIRRRAIGAATAGLMLLSFLAAGTPLADNPFLTRSFFGRVAEEFDFILQVKGHRARNMAVIGSVLEKSKTVPSSLDKLHGADVYLFFVESYGYTIFSDPRHFPKIKPDLVALEKKLKDHGFGIVSNFFSSPTFGGSSWLAHASLASGVHLNSQMRYNLLITSQVKTLARYFNDAGYRTVLSMPDTRWPWPEGEFYGYQAKYYAWNFDYRGPTYGWSTMPDQYVLDFIRRREMTKPGRPQFIEFILGSSHAPFHRQPPYLPDWSRIGNGAVYNDLEIITFPIVWPDLTNASEGYVAAIRYDLTVLSEFISQFVKDDALIVILGDHQPNVQLTGPNQLWSVPVHVLSRDKDFIKAFQNRGFLPGLIPTQPPPHRGMESFLFDFLEDFSTQE